MASFVARFECAVCQGTASHAEYAALTCGHAFHAVCINAWLAKGTKSCPSCRAHASARSIRVLVGVETVPLEDGDSGELCASAQQPTGGCGCSSELRRQLAEKQEQADTLAAQLSEAQEHAGEVEHTACQLLQQQHTLTHKLKASKDKVADLEAGRLQDAKRLTEATRELGQWQERYRSDTVRLQRQLQDEARRSARAEADLRRLMLQNPTLSLQGIQAILSSESEQGQLSALLARRNQQLQEVQTRMAELQAQLADQQRATEAEAEAARSRSKAAAVRAAREKEEAMKTVLQLEFANGKLEAENGSLRRQLQELQQVLLALQEGGPPGPQQRQRQPPLDTPVQPPWRQQQQQQHRQGSDQQQQQERRQQQQFQAPDPGDDDEAWLTEPPVDQQELEATQLDVAAAVGRLQPLSVASAPSFLRQQHQQAAARPGGVTGQFLRTGPDGRGSTARHGTTTGQKRAAPPGPHPQAGSRKARPAVQAGAGSIRAFFGAAATRR